MQIGDHLGAVDLADQFAVERVDPDAAGGGDVDIAVLVGLHAVGQAGLQPVLDAAGEESAILQPLRRHVEQADIGLLGVVHPHPALAGRKGEAVGLAEQIAVHDQFGLVPRNVARREAIDALKAELQRARHAEMLPATIGRVGEPDRAVIADDDVVGAVQLASLIMRAEDGAGPVGRDARHGRG